MDNNLKILFLFIALGFGVLFFYNFFNDKNYISSVIVPHHDLVKEERKELLKEVSKKVKPKTIILISPNHFLSGKSEIATTIQNWVLSNGVISSDEEKIEKLISEGLITEDKQAFLREHGITNLLAQIKENFHDSKLIPIIFKPSAPRERVKKIAKELSKSCAKNECLVISSVDFSHYQPASLAELHDKFSLKALENLDEDKIYEAEVDSNHSLNFAIQWAKLHNTLGFNLKENTNSGNLSRDWDIETTSYVFGWYEKGQIKKIKEDITFNIVGSLSISDNGDSRQYGKTLGDRFFDGTDISMVSLLNNVNDKQSNLLKYLNINTLNIADPKVLCPRVDFNCITASYEPKELIFGSQRIYIFNLNDKFHINIILEQIRNIKRPNSFVIVFLGKNFGSEDSKEIFFNLAKVKADIVISYLSNIEEPMRDSNTLFFRLGNLSFGQNKEKNFSLAIGGSITDKETKIILLPLINKSTGPELVRGDEKKDIINQIRSSIGFDYCKDILACDIINIKN